MGEEVEIQRGMEEDVRRGGRMRRNLITLFTVTGYCLHSATNESALSPGSPALIQSFKI